jgi:hypothetical protein
VTTHQPNIAALLEAALNLSRHHRDHEKYYASAPRETAVQLQRHARTLQALADRWSTIEPSTRHAVSPYEGADDLNSAAATQLEHFEVLRHGRSGDRQEVGELADRERPVGELLEDGLPRGVSECDEHRGRVRHG